MAMPYDAERVGQLRKMLVEARKRKRWISATSQTNSPTAGRWLRPLASVPAVAGQEIWASGAVVDHSHPQCRCRSL